MFTFTEIALIVCVVLAVTSFFHLVVPPVPSPSDRVLYGNHPVENAKKFRNYP